jgi:amino acid permease
MKTSQAKTRLSFWEATSIIIGHGVGAGIQAVPYLASRNSLRELLLILGFCFLFNLLLHLIIAELSYNNDGAQFIACFDREMFSGKLKNIFTWAAFALLGLSVIVNVSAFLTGAAEVLAEWCGLPSMVCMLLFYIVGAGVVFFGLKLVGVCEKFSVAAMVLVVGVLLAVVLRGKTQPLGGVYRGWTNAAALFGSISFSLSAVMSTPQVVKGLQKDKKKILGSIAAGLGINAALILLVTLTTLLGAGEDVSKKGALLDLGKSIGGWPAVVAYLFSLFALATSFWANTLNLRDIVHEQTRWNEKLSWLAASLPCLVFAALSSFDFVDLSRFAGVIQVVTGIGVIVAYALSRKRVGKSALVGKFGTPIFLILVGLCTLLATVGSVLPVK